MTLSHVKQPYQVISLASDSISAGTLPILQIDSVYFPKESFPEIARFLLFDNLTCPESYLHLQLLGLLAGIHESA